jgi:hypothetical protein
MAIAYIFRSSKIAATGTHIASEPDSSFPEGQPRIKCPKNHANCLILQVTDLHFAFIKNTQN